MCARARIEDPAVRLTVPVASPRLPTVAEAMPYLARVDAGRVYTNRGPLCRELEARLAARLDVPADRVVTVANATLGLALALAAQRPERDTLCVVPAFSFAACPQAVELAGLVPWLADVSPQTWALSPRATRELAHAGRGRVGAILAVSPFGQPLPVEPWEDLARELGVPLVLDCAAGFDSLRPGRAPAVVSLHATKILGVGEGGFVVTTDAALADRIRRGSSFGFGERGETPVSRDALVRGLNAKMSEYHAAIGLAALDAWASTRSAFLRVALAYREALRGRSGIELQEGYGTGWVSSATVVRLREVRAKDLARLLAEEGIETRAWWGRGLHRQPAFSTCPARKTSAAPTSWRSERWGCPARSTSSAGRSSGSARRPPAPPAGPRGRDAVDGEPVVILGAGRHGRNVLDVLRELDLPVLGFLDDTKPVGELVNGARVLGRFESFREPALLAGARFLVAVGDNEARCAAFAGVVAAGGRLAGAVHPSCVVSPSARLGRGVYLGAFSRVLANAAVGDYCLVEGHASVGADTVLGEGVATGRPARSPAEPGSESAPTWGPAPWSWGRPASARAA